MSGRFRIPLLASSLAVAAPGCVPAEYAVVRVVDGQESAGRFVSHQAYAEYARGTIAEARGDLEAANEAYRRALSHDADSTEIWTRLGALRCRLGRGNPWVAFDHAEAIDPSYEPVWRERAQCWLQLGQLQKALRAAERAARLDPNRVSSSLTVIAIQERLGRLHDARRWLDALVARSPASILAQQAMLEFAERQKDEARAQRAAEQLIRSKTDLEAAGPRTALGKELRRKSDEALLAGNIAQARRFAALSNLSPGVLAVRAVLLGRPELGLMQAQWVLSADPDDGDAWVAALAAADLTGNALEFERALSLPVSGPVCPTNLGAILFGGLLRRYIGEEAARTWLGNYGPLQPPQDELETRFFAQSSTP